MPRYRKKYGKRKYVKRSRKLTGSKRLKKVIKQVVRRAAETKSNQHTSATLNIFQPITQTEVFSLLPVISQGTGQANRIGNKINPIRFTVKLAVFCNNLSSYYVGPSSTYFDVYIFKWKEANQAGGVPQNVDMTQFLQDDNTAQSYDGQFLDGLRPVNSDKFTLLAKRRITLNNVYNTTVGQMSGYYQSTAPQKTLYFNLTKHCKKTWTYNDTTTSVANDNIYIAIGTTQCDSTNLGANVIGYYQFISDLQYKDT